MAAEVTAVQRWRWQHNKGFVVTTVAMQQQGSCGTRCPQTPPLSAGGVKRQRRLCNNHGGSAAAGLWNEMPTDPPRLQEG